MDYPHQAHGYATSHKASGRPSFHVDNIQLLKQSMWLITNCHVSQILQLRYCRDDQWIAPLWAVAGGRARVHHTAHSNGMIALKIYSAEYRLCCDTNIPNRVFLCLLSHAKQWTLCHKSTTWQVDRKSLYRRQILLANNQGNYQTGPCWNQSAFAA